MNDKAFIDTNVFIYLYSEYLADGQVIENKLTVLNIYSKNNLEKYLK